MDLKLLILSLLATSLYIDLASCIDCSQPHAELKGDEGQLDINKNVATCGFIGDDNTTFLALKTDGLRLKANDRLSIASTKDANHSTIFKPPFDTGYILVGVPSPNITFDFDKPENNTMQAQFSKVPSIPLNGDINNQIRLTPIALPNIELDFTKSVADTIHLEVVGATIKGGIHPRHALIQENSRKITLDLVSGQIATIKTSSVLNNCSKTNVGSKKEEVYRLEGPLAAKYRQKYKCVNFFSTLIESPTAHFLVDFSDFIDIVDDEDQLIIDDGQSNTRLDIVKAGASEYTGQVRHFRGKNLIVIYESPRVLRPSNIQFKLTVASKSNGGIVDAAKAGLEFSKPVQYILQPQHEEYASISTSNLNLKGANITISSDRHSQATLRSLPPMIALSEPGTRMIIDYTSNVKSSGTIDYKPLTTSCHKFSTTTSDGFSVAGAKGSCIWTIAPQEPVTVKFDYINLPSGCLSLTQLSDNKQIFNRCNLGPTDLLPPFVVNQAYINVTLLTDNSRLDATISRSPISANNNVQLASVINITSQTYPLASAWSNLNTEYILNTTGKTYTLTVVDIDLRDGEKMMIDKTPMISEKDRLTTGLIDITNKVTKLTVDRTKVDKDFSNHRGFKLQAEQFDKLIVAGKSPVVTPKNVTSVLLMISTSKSDTFGKRINYNMTFANSKDDFDVTVIDSRVLNGRPIIGDKYHDYSTSDALLIRYATKKKDSTLPVATIEYSLVECNRTSDHLCDYNTRCVPREKLCKNGPYCEDKSDLKGCGGGPAPEPRIIETGVGGVAVFMISVFMLVVGALSALFGPDLVRSLETRFRSGQYTTFTSAD